MSNDPPAAPQHNRNEGRVPGYGSDIIVDLLHDLGIEYAAFNPGATFRGIHDSIVNYGGNRRPEVIECCHEELSVAIAHGYAKAKGRPMAALTHNIVGLQHASMAIFNAWCDRVPVMVMGGTGPMDTTQRRPWIDWIHTALVQGNQVRDYVKWDDQPYSVAAIPDSMLRAYQLAVTPPCGPIYLCFDVLLQEDPLPAPIEVPDVRDYAPPTSPGPDPVALRSVADRLLEARYPVILTDLTGRDPTAFRALVALAEALGAPVIDKGNSFSFPTDHPLNLSRLDADILPQADLILALDVVDLHGALRTVDRHSRGPHPYLANASARIVHIKLDHLATRNWAADYQRLQPTALTVTADTAVALPALLDQVTARLAGDTSRQAMCQARAQDAAARHMAVREQWRRQAAEARSQSPISAPRLALALGEAVRGYDWVLTNDSRDSWISRLCDLSEPGQYLGRHGGGGLGYGLGASMGVALAHKGSGKLCIDVQPDGDFLCTPSGLWTAARHRIPLLTIMWNNASYYNSEVHQGEIAKKRGRPTETAGVGTLLDGPVTDFAGLARSFGVEARGPIEDPDDLGPALRWGIDVVMKEGRPALIDLRAQKK